MADQILVARDELIPMPPPRPSPRQRPDQAHRRLVSSGGTIPAAIFSRTRDIIASNMTELLERAEDPAKMIRMIIMEMEETLIEVRASAARSIADQKDMERQIAKLDRLQDSWMEKAELALSKDREDLAKAALVERSKIGDIADSLRSELAIVDDALRSMEGDIARLQNKLREARTRQNNIQSRFESAQNRVRLREMYAGPKVEAAFSRFETLEREVDYAEGRAEALALASPKSLDDEISELRNAEKVDAELEAMKARHAAGGEG
jgi:phage shock protein A